MHDLIDDFELDEHGNKRRKRVLRDLEQISFPMTMAFKDAAGFHTHFSDGSPDHTSPHKPGYRFLDVDDAAKIAADEAYQARSRRMATAWKRKGDAQANANGDGTPVRTHTNDELQRDAQAAYDERTKRMQNAWRHD